MFLQISVHGEDIVARRLERIGAHAGDATPVFESLATYFFETEREQFESEGGHSGGWAPLKPETVDAKRRAGLDTRILHATLALRHSLTERGAEGQLLMIGPAYLAFGSTLHYAIFHQKGTRNMPRRPPFDLHQMQRREVVKKLQRFIMTGHV